MLLSACTLKACRTYTHVPLSVKGCVRNILSQRPNVLLQSSRTLSFKPLTAHTHSGLLRSTVPKNTIIQHSSKIVRRTCTSEAVAKTTWSGSAAQATKPAATLSMSAGQQRRIGLYFVGLSVMTVGAVVLGGVTRLTESGLSMVNWHPLYGIRPPITAEEWEEEFREYQKYPEFKYTNKNMTVDEFKNIFYMEWFHRIWGRTIGIVYAVPAVYYLSRRWVPTNMKRTIGFIGVLIGCQGLMGWYMVKSGLKDDPDPNAVPRVSQYRLCAHLGLALVIYTMALWCGLKHLSKPSIIADIKAVAVRRNTHMVTGLVFTTALSGAFVAGLDAGLVYNSFPMMADRWIPTDMWAFDPWYKNLLENPTTVQFNHRVLGMSTFASVMLLWAQSRKVHLPVRAKLAVNCLAGMVCVQVSLGIATLLYFVPTPLAATHQSGSVALLTIALWLMSELRLVRKIVPRL